MTMTVGARSLDNEERSNFRDYSGDDAVFSMLRHPSVSGGDEWWNW